MSAQPDPPRRRSEWLDALRDDEDRAQWRSLWSRSRRSHPLLYWLMLASLVGGWVLRLVARGAGSPALAFWLWLGSLLVAFVCLVLLVRRDDPPAGS